MIPYQYSVLLEYIPLSVVSYLNIKIYVNICHLTQHVFHPKNYIDLQWNYVELNTSDCEPISSKLLLNHN